MTVIETNPFLAGNFAPIRREIESEALTVIGELPAALSGIFVRNGPNPQFPPLGQYHWFDGDGMLHGVEIRDGKASYRNRYIHTAGFIAEREAGKAIWTGLLEPMQTDLPTPMKNTANTALVRHGGQFLALWEGGAPHAIALPELDTQGQYTFGDRLQSPFTAHPKVDPVTGEMLFFGYSLTQPPFVQYGIVAATGELTRQIAIDIPVGVMMHDFAVSENYTIFLDLPLECHPEQLERGGAMLSFVKRPARFGILPRHGDSDQVRWFESEPCYIFHTLNAYDEGDEVVLIACPMASTSVLGGGSGLSSSEQEDTPYLHRWRFNLATGTVKEERLDDLAGEFPWVNEAYVGRSHRYGYVAKFVPGTEMPLFDGIVKYDFEQDKREVHSYGEGRYGGEAVFVPRPGATEEDDGWLMGFVHDENTQISELVVIDARAMSAPPTARVQLPQRVPYGFHGTWVAF